MELNLRLMVVNWNPGASCLTKLARSLVQWGRFSEKSVALDVLRGLAPATMILAAGSFGSRFVDSTGDSLPDVSNVLFCYQLSSLMFLQDGEGKGISSGIAWVHSQGS